MASVSFKGDTRSLKKIRKVEFQGLKHEQVFMKSVIQITGTSLTNDGKRFKEIDPSLPHTQPFWLLNY